jgi:predicted ArsR family transcriptional regulator
MIAFTASRAANLRRLVAELQQRDMSRADISQLLDVSESPACRYLADLRRAGVAEFSFYRGAARGSLGAHVYRITADGERVRAYLDLLSEPRAPQSRTALAIALRDPSRRLYFAMDDEPFEVPVHRGPVRRDPMVAALFGAGRHEVRA